MVCSTLRLPQGAQPVLGTDLNRSESTPGRAVRSPRTRSRIWHYLSMRSFLIWACQRPCPRCPRLHHNRDTRGLRRAPVRQRRFLATSVDTGDPRAAPPRGLEEERPLDCLLERKIARRFPMSFSNSVDGTPRRVASRIFLMSDKLVVGSSELGPRRNVTGETSCLGGKC
jgi:hypothetical protein